jgi:hypothetical protein
LFDRRGLAYFNCLLTGNIAARLMRTATGTATAAIGSGGRTHDLGQANPGRKGNDKKEIFHRNFPFKDFVVIHARAAARSGHGVSNSRITVAAELEDDEAAATLSRHDRLLLSSRMLGR